MASATQRRTEPAQVSGTVYDRFIQQEDALQGWEQQYLPMTTDAYRGAVSVVDFGAVTLFRETVNLPFINRFYLPAGRAFVSVALRGAAPTYNACGEYCAGHGHLLNFTSEAEVVSSGPVDLVGITFDPGDSPAAGAHFWTRIGADALPFGEWIAALVGGFVAGHASDELRQIAPLLVADRLSLLVDDGPRAAPRAARALGRTVMAELGALSPADMTVAALSDALGHSPADLRAAFRDTCDRDLDATLVALRLGHVHRRLVRATRGSVTVSAVAADDGFLHWGRFAQIYRTMFGESPVETLRRPPAH